jgi:hypothetical protein
MCLSLLVYLAGSVSSSAASNKVLKVLPFFVDAEGRHSLSPSLYERDAYQAMLAKHQSLQAGLRYAVQWKHTGPAAPNRKLRLELRGSNSHTLEPLMQEQAVQRSGWFGHWTKFEIDAATCQQLGRVIAWRVTLREGDQELAEQKSFLW